MEIRDVTVIGAGLIGSAAARHLAEKGLSEMEQTIALLSKTLERHETLTDEGRAYFIN